MNNLTTRKKKVLNNLSQVLDSTVALGDIIEEIIGSSGETGTPVNAVAAKAIMTISGVSVDGEIFMVGNDVYEFLADAAQTKTVSTNIPIDISAKTVKATGVLTIDTHPTSGDTFTIGTKTYIFVPVGTANSVGEVSIGADLAGAKTAIVSAINGTDGHNTPHPTVTASAFVADACTITALIGGTIGNAIPTTETFTAVTNVFAAVTLGLGTNCTTANTIIAIVAAIVAHDTQGVTGAPGEGNTIVLVADVAGVAGNNITLDSAMVNASFDHDTLSGGINGTIAESTSIKVDATYLYICPTGNTISQTNWRRIALGAAY